MGVHWFSIFHSYQPNVWKEGHFQSSPLKGMSLASVNRKQGRVARTAAEEEKHMAQRKVSPKCVCEVIPGAQVETRPWRWLRNEKTEGYCDTRKWELGLEGVKKTGWRRGKTRVWRKKTKECRYGLQSLLRVTGGTEPVTRCPESIRVLIFSLTDALKLGMQWKFIYCFSTWTTSFPPPGSCCVQKRNTNKAYYTFVQFTAR